MFNKNDKYTEFVNVYDTFVDSSYQRVTHTSVKKIADSFDWCKVGLPKLSKRSDGTYAIIDGQHRLEAFKLWLSRKKDLSEADKLIECEILTGLTPQEEAYLFAAQDNNKVGVSSIEEFKAAVYANIKTDPFVRMNNICKKHGLEIVAVDSKRAGVRCLRTLREKMIVCGDDYLEYYCQAITKSGWQDNFVAYKDLFVSTFFQLYKNGVKINSLVSELKKWTPKELIFSVQKSNSSLHINATILSRYITERISDVK